MPYKFACKGTTYIFEKKGELTRRFRVLVYTTFIAIDQQIE
jgi:hypothetical protein